MKNQFKLIALALSALLMALVLIGCGEKPVAEAPAPVRVPYMASPEDCTPLTAEELAFFNDEYFTLGAPSYPKWLAYSDYNAPEEINLWETFQLSSEQAAQEEREAVTKLLGETAPSYLLVKVSAEKMETVLQEYLGLDLEETDKAGLDRMTYVEEYDAYYYYRDEYSAAGGQLQAYYGERDGEGNVFLFYQWNNWNAPVGWILQLQEQPDGGYHFISNRLPGIPYVNEAVSAGVCEAATNVAFQAFYELAAQDMSDPEAPYKAMPVLDYRVNDVALVKEIAIGGENVAVYRLSYALRPQAGAPVPAWEGGFTTADGWLSRYSGANYLIYWDAMEDEIYAMFTSMEAVITDLTPEDEGFDARIAELLEGRPELTADERPTALNLVFADSEKLIFTTDRALCFYDLAAGQIDALVDFVPYDEDSNRSRMGQFILREDGTPVEVSMEGTANNLGLAWQLPELLRGGGKWIPTEPVRHAPNEDYENVARGESSDSFMSGSEETTYYSNDPEMQNRTVAERVELVPNFDDPRRQAMLSSLAPPEPIPEGYIASEMAMPFPDGNGWLYSEDGKLGGLQYIQGEKYWNIFEGYFE